jgi:hypothetical protein
MDIEESALLAAIEPVFWAGGALVVGLGCRNS